MDRRRITRERSAVRTGDGRNNLPRGGRERRRNAPHPRRRGHPVRPRQPGRHGPRFGLVHARARPEEAVARRSSAAVPEVHRARQQPRLLREHAGRDEEHEPRHVPRVAAAGGVQPPPDRPARHGAVLPAVPRPVQLQLRPARRQRHRRTRRRDDAAVPGRRQAGRDDALGRPLLDVVQRRAAHHRVLPQHDRAAHGDGRQPDAVAHRVQPRDAASQSGLPRADRAAGVALPPVGRILRDREQGGSRLRLPTPRATPAQHLADGRERDRSRE